MEGTPQAKIELPEPNLSPLTPDEQALANRVAGSSEEWQTINERDVNDFSLSEDPFKLPLPAQKLEAAKKFKFRWFTRTPQRVDEVKSFQKVRRWWVVNGTQPVPGAFDAYIDGSTGGVHHLDQLLFFKPWWLWEAEDALDRKLADAQSNLTEKDGEEKNSLRYAASKRSGKEKSAGRQEVTGSDILFKGEADYDAEVGKVTPLASSEELGET
jgi:hypothetical protein